MKEVIRKIWFLPLLAMVSMVASAQEQEETPPAEEPAPVIVNLNDSYIGGSIEVTDYSEPADDGSIVVTIMVKPDYGYYIAKSDIVVVSTVSAAGTRDGVSIGGDLELEGEDPDPLTGKRDYRFTVAAGLGAWVKEANFHQVVRAPEDISGDAESTVTWSYADNVLTITGTGSTFDFDDGNITDPWTAIRDQITTVNIGSGVTALGDGIFQGCNALTLIRIANAAEVLSIGEGAIPANEGLEIYVPANLLNEYRITDGWSDLKTASENAVTMDGITYSANNQYDTFVSDQAIVVPSVLSAYTVTGIDGTGLELTEVKTIAANMPVLVYNKNDLKDVTYYSAPAAATRADDNLLQVAGSEGRKVSLGEVYILHNDVFYYCQAGIIPAGRVYLENPVPSSTRSFYTLGDSGSTGMELLRHQDTGTQTDVWYSLDGRRLSTMPTRKGIYIKNGKKFIIK